MRRYKDRAAWILQWMQRRGVLYVDVLRTDFVCDYIDETGATSSLMLIGAPKCRRLSDDLLRMYRDGVLKRFPAGLGRGDSSMGFPKWIWSYSVRHDPRST